MPEIKFLAAQDDLGNWAVPLRPEEVSNSLVEWTFDSSPRSAISIIQVNDGIEEIAEELEMKRGKNGQYSPQSYNIAYALSYARVHLLGRSFSEGEIVTQKTALEQIDAIPVDIRAVYVQRAEGGGMLKPRAGTTPLSEKKPASPE